MNLKHVVITVVARDDLKDGGAGVLAETVGLTRWKIDLHPSKCYLQIWVG